MKYESENRLLQQFHELTEIEIKATTDTINSNSEKYASVGDASIMAIIKGL